MAVNFCIPKRYNQFSDLVHQGEMKAVLGTLNTYTGQAVPTAVK